METTKPIRWYAGDKERDLKTWGPLERNPSKPFVHKVETWRHKYLYDANTCVLLRVDRVVWDIIEDFGCLPDTELVDKYSPMHPAEAVRGAIQEIDAAQRTSGYFLARYPHMDFELAGEHSNHVETILGSGRKQMSLNVTERCNFRCRYCPYTREHDTVYRNHSNRDMDWSTAKKALDDFLAHAIDPSDNDGIPPVINFYGGEPLLNFDLIRKCVNYAETIHSGRILFQMTTNGWHLRDDVAEFLFSKGFIVSVSLDGPKHVHDRHRRTANGSPVWDRVVKSIKECLHKYGDELERPGLGTKLSINAVLAPDVDCLEVETFFSLCDYLRERDVCITANLMNPSLESPSEPEFDGRRMSYNIDALHEAYLENLVRGEIARDPDAFPVQHSLFHRRYRDIHRGIHSMVAPREDPQIRGRYTTGFSTCIPATHKYHVAVDGTYYPCERVPEGDEMSLGNVFSGLDAVKSRRMYRQWYDYCHGDCEYCWALGFCEIGCWANVRDKRKFTKEAVKKACERERAAMHRLMTNYCIVMEENPNAFGSN